MQAACSRKGTYKVSFGESQVCSRGARTEERAMAAARHICGVLPNMMIIKRPPDDICSDDGFLQKPVTVFAHALPNASSHLLPKRLILPLALCYYRLPHITSRPMLMLLWFICCCCLLQTTYMLLLHLANAVAFDGILIDDHDCMPFTRSSQA